jgi:hypothetical protein
MTDGFVNAWGPRLSRRGRARRARALAHQAALDFEAAQGAAMAAVLLQPVAVDNPGGWGTGGGWGDVGTWGAAPSAPSLWAAPLGNTWGWGGGANRGWGGAWGAPEENILPRATRVRPASLLPWPTLRILPRDPMDRLVFRLRRRKDRQQREKRRRHRCWAHDNGASRS